MDVTTIITQEKCRKEPRARLKFPLPESINLEEISPQGSDVDVQYEDLVTLVRRVFYALGSDSPVYDHNLTGCTL